MRRPYILLIGVGCFTSCHKTDTSPNKDWTWFGTYNAAVYNYVLINANQVIDKGDTDDFHIGVSAAFVDSVNNKLSGIDNLSVNDQPITPNLDSTYSYDYAKQGLLNDGLALYGTNVTISIKGNSDIDTVSQSVYLPKRLVNEASAFPDTIDLSRDVRLKWTIDPANPWGHVLVQVFYYAQLSIAADSSLPQQVKTLSYTVPDTGSFTIRAGDMRIYPVKSYIGISIARGTQSEVVLPISRRRVFYFSSSSASTQPMVVVDNSN